MSRRLLAVEPYYGGSHRAVLDGLLERLAERGWDADLLTLPPRKWKWRMSGASVVLADRVRELAADGRRWDLVYASTFANLPEFLGLSGSALAGVPAVVYFHENQLAYPVRAEEEWDFQYPLTNIKSALAAAVCPFNSRYNRDSFLEAIPAFLRRFPDELPQRVVERLSERSSVLAPPFDPAPFDAAPLVRGRVPRVVWPHRWEHDKDPEAFFSAVARLAEEGLEFEVVVAGQSFVDTHEEVRVQAEALGSRLVALGGLQGRDEFAEMLCTCDIAVSTARHEFFGLAMMEAAYAGCLPLVPDRLAYPELYPAEMRYRSPAELAAKLRTLLTDARPEPNAAREIAERYTFDALLPEYEALFERVAGRSEGVEC